MPPPIPPHDAAYLRTLTAELVAAERSDARFGTGSAADPCTLRVQAAYRKWRGFIRTLEGKDG